MLLFVGGARIFHLGSIVGGLTMIGGAGGNDFRIQERILTFINGLTEGGNVNIQVLQSKIALGSGGFLAFEWAQQAK